MIAAVAGIAHAKFNPYDIASSFFVPNYLKLLIVVSDVT